jgi:hypothetical protein
MRTPLDRRQSRSNARKQGKRRVLIFSRDRGKNEFCSSNWTSDSKRTPEARPTGSSHIESQMKVSLQGLFFCFLCLRTPVKHEQITLQTLMVARMFPSLQLRMN